MKNKTFFATTKSVNIEDRTLEAIASTNTVDREGDLILPSAFELAAFLKNPVILANHTYYTSNGAPTVIGKVLNIQATDNALEFTMQFAQTDLAEEYFQLYKDGFMNAFSVGFIPKKYTYPEDNNSQKDVRRIFTEVELLEISCVAIPANREALAKAVKAGNSVAKNILAEIETKTVLPYADLPIADEKLKWDSAAAKKRVKDWASDKDGNVDFKKYSKAFLYVVKGAEDNLTGYKLPFADIVNGSLKAIWRGVSAAMAALLGARGGVNIPDADKKKIYNNLAKYYKKFDKEVPEFKSEEKEVFNCECISCGYTMQSEEHCSNITCPECGGEMRRAERPGPGKSIDENQIKAGAVLNKKNLQRLEQIIQLANEIISETKKDDEDNSENKEKQNKSQRIYDAIFQLSGRKATDNKKNINKFVDEIKKLKSEV